MNQKGPQTLPIKPISQAIKEAKDLIDSERSGNITGLFTRWKGINRGFLKYSRFGQVTMIAGTSGSGKSAILNMIEDDFTNPILNPSFLLPQPKIHILAFKYEMDASDEILRNLSGKVQKSYSYLLSSQVIEPDKQVELEQYNKVNDEEYNTYSETLDTLASKPISYIETAGNLDQLYNTCVAFNKANPHVRLVITLDHTLLSVKLSEKDDLELSARTAQVAIKLRKALGANIIFINQLNGEIEKIARRDNPTLQYPVKTDIHCGNQVFWACDNVLIFHRPETLQIEKYGPTREAVNSKDVIHCNWVKSRKGNTGHVWFRNEFKIGNMVQVEKRSLLFKET